jgi:hypothetical protein
MSRDTLSDATYIISATLPTSFSCYIAMIWLTTAGYRFPWRFWNPQRGMNVRNCASYQWLSLLAMQALVGTIFGTMIVVTKMVENEEEFLAALAIAILLVGVILMWFSVGQVRTGVSLKLLVGCLTCSVYCTHRTGTKVNLNLTVPMNSRSETRRRPEKCSAQHMSSSNLKTWANIYLAQ